METTQYAEIQKLALKQLKSGQSLTGKGGAFAPFIKQFLEAAWRQKMRHISVKRSGVEREKKRKK